VTRQVLVDGAQVDGGGLAEPTATEPLDAGDTAVWRGTATYERLP
jgi:hypothetical protein